MSESKSKVLMIDDNQDMLEVFEESIGDKYAFKTFDSAQMALDHLQSHFEYDAIICDYSMPDMNGAEFLQNLRRGGMMIPIVFFTAYMDLPLALEALRLGATDIIEKPCSPALLSEVIERVIMVEGLRRQYYQGLKRPYQKDKMLGLLFMGNRAKNKKLSNY